MTRFSAVWLSICFFAGTAAGCALWPEDADVTAEKTPLKQLRPAADAIVVDILFVERPLGDPLLGNSLWSTLDQISTLDAKTLAALDRNGFRFGVASSDPPRALQAALGMTGEAVPRDESQQMRLGSRRITRRSGEELSIDTWSGYPQCEVWFDEGSEKHVATYENARCVFRVRVERMQDGWAKLQFVPEIHHGEMKMRSVPNEFDWATTASQQVDPRFDQRLELELNLGEMVVLGAGGDDQRTLGHHFFRGGQTESHMQRLLIVRLADMQRVEALYE